jgi:hypothetical protein
VRVVEIGCVRLVVRGWLCEVGCVIGCGWVVVGGWLWLWLWVVGE